MLGFYLISPERVGGRSLVLSIDRYVISRFYYLEICVLARPWFCGDLAAGRFRMGPILTHASGRQLICNIGAGDLAGMPCNNDQRLGWRPVVVMTPICRGLKRSSSDKIRDAQTKAAPTLYTISPGKLRVQC